MAAIYYPPLWRELLQVAPLIVACLVGLAMALAHWRQAPRAAALVLAAASMVAAELIARHVAIGWLITYSRQHGWQGDQMMLASNAVVFMGAAVQAAAADPTPAGHS